MRGARWISADGYELAPDARRFENWEFPYALVLGLGAAARYLLDADIEHVSSRALMLASKLRESLGRFSRVIDRGEKRAAIVTADFGTNASEIVAFLRQRRINVSATFRQWAILDMEEKGVESAVRISPHYYNSEEEVDAVVDALRSLKSGAA